jgi:DNA-binding transcriptional LysR family regulator
MSRSIRFGAMMSGAVDLRRLRYFVAVADELHFGRAAARLHISAPPLSQRIGELEAELGLRLFDRTSRRVALTAAGERLLVEARAVLDAADHFEQVALECAASAHATLAVGYCHGSGLGVFRLIRAFQTLHPDTPVRPDALTSLRSMEALRAGRISVGVVRAPLPDDRTIASQPLARVPMDHLALPNGHPLAAKQVVSAIDLDGEPVLLVDRGDAPTAHDETVAYCRALGVRPAWVHHPATQAERMLDMVAVGSGIGWLNQWQAHRVQRDDVTVRPLAPVERFDEFVLVWRADDPSSVRAAFVALASEVDLAGA